MTEYLDCSDEECIEKWIENKYDEWYGEEYQMWHHDFLPQHCEVDDCHNIYLKGKNGYTCSYCGLEVCDDCNYYRKILKNLGDDYSCSQCYADYQLSSESKSENENNE